MQKVLSLFLVLAVLSTGCSFESTIDPHEIEESIKEVGNTLESKEKRKEFEAWMGLGLMECRAEIADEVGSGRVSRLDSDPEGGFDDEYADLVQEHCPFIAGQNAKEILNIEDHPGY